MLFWNVFLVAKTPSIQIIPGGNYPTIFACETWVAEHTPRGTCSTRAAKCEHDETLHKMMFLHNRPWYVRTYTFAAALKERSQREISKRVLKDSSQREFSTIIFTGSFQREFSKRELKRVSKDCSQRELSKTVFNESWQRWFSKRVPPAPPNLPNSSSWRYGYHIRFRSPFGLSSSTLETSARKPIYWAPPRRMAWARLVLDFSAWPNTQYINSRGGPFGFYWISQRVVSTVYNMRFTKKQTDTPQITIL